MSIYSGNPAATITTSAMIPDDGTAIKASDVNAPFGVLLDNDAAMKAKLPAIQLAIQPLSRVDIGGAYLARLSHPGPGSAVLGSTLTTIVLPPTASVGDILRAELVMDYVITGNPGWPQATAHLVTSQGNSGPYGAPLTLPISGAEAVIASSSTTASPRTRLVLTGQEVVHNPGYLSVSFQVDLGGSCTFDIYGTGCLRVSLLHVGA